MHLAKFIVREPLLDPHQRVIGYELSWQQSGAAPAAAAEMEALVGFVAGQLNDERHGWLLRDKLLFLDAVPAMLSTDALHAMPPEFTVLSIAAAALRNRDTLAAVQGLRAGGVGIALRDADLARVGQTVLASASYIEVRFSGADVAEQARVYAALKRSSQARMVGRPVTTWADFDACAALGLDAFVGKLHLTPRPGNAVKGLSPAQSVIVQLMRMVRQNAPVAHLESVLKRDAALSYKLLRFINSASFGLGHEVHSLRQALALLGYAPLYRWLTLLLATSSSGYSPVLMEAAVIRGRLAELLGLPALGAQAAEDLFVAGMFSLLDRLLGIPMQQVLETIVLPAPVTAALLARDGLYGPYVALAEACELNSNLVSSLAASLELSPLAVNQAHLSALAWAQNLAPA